MVVRAANRAGPADEYSSHSLRSGLATSARLAGRDPLASLFQLRSHDGAAILSRSEPSHEAKADSRMEAVETTCGETRRRAAINAMRQSTVITTGR